MSRPQSGVYGTVPTPNDAQVSRGYGINEATSASDFAQGNPETDTTSPLSQSLQNQGAFHEEFDASRRGSSLIDDGKRPGIQRSTSTASKASTTLQGSAPSRNNTLKKRSSMRRTGSLKRSSSKRSLKAGSLAGFGGVDKGSDEQYNSAFSTPVPTSGTPTEILANRFQAWRQLLKSLIAYFREIQASYEVRAKATHKVQNLIGSITHPSIFMSENGLGDATRVLDEYHKKSITEANKSREIENDVIGALTGLRSDLGQKIKEIKSLSGDFKNSVEKEKDATRREAEKLQEALQQAEKDDGSAVGKNDPFVVKLGVDRAVERQIDEENYLHRAYLNLESSGRELESIVVGEIQKAYNALAGILKREGDDAYHAVEGLRTGPIAMPKDAEWLQFVQNDPHFVDPNAPLRKVENIEYPGKHHPAAAEVRAGMLERKSKYLKSYTAGWYVLSPTHLHEFKSADKIYSQPPVMSLYLPDQKLGSHSQTGSSSHKFMLKGRQSGNMHKGHNWVFRAETYDTMQAWYEDIRVLTETSGEQRNAYVRKHARSFSGTSDRATVSSDGMEEDEADEVPYSADVKSLQSQEARPVRPHPGGHFGSDLQVPRARGVSMGQSSTSSNDNPNEIAMAGAVPASSQVEYDYARNGQDPYRLEGVSAGTRPGTASSAYTGTYFEETQPVMRETIMVQEHQQQPYSDDRQAPMREPIVPQQQQQQPFLADEPAYAPAEPSNTYGDWLVAVAGVAAGTGVAAVATTVYQEDNAPLADRNIYLDGGKETSDFQYESRELAGTDTPVAASTASAGNDALGGLEQDGARETGAIFPQVVRHNTAMSVSQLYVPGQYPKEA